MAPKRSSGRKLVASVVKTTRRVVEVVTGTGGATKTTTSDKKEIVEEVINGGGETETVEMTTTTTTTATNTALETPTTTTIDIPVEDVEATTKAGKRSRRLVEKSPEAADLGQEEEDRISMGDEETETETQEPEFPMDDPKIYDISTPPRVEGPQKNQEKEEAQSGGKRTRTAQSEEEKTQKRRRKRMGVVGEGYKRYIHKVLKQVHPDLGISGKAMTVVNNFMSDMFERLAFEAGKLSDYGGRLTMTASEVQAAVKLVLPGELGKHAVAEGSKAVVTYMKGNS